MLLVYLLPVELQLLLLLPLLMLLILTEVSLVRAEMPNATQDLTLEEGEITQF